MTSKLNFRGLVEALPTNLLRVTRSDFFALLLPQADSKHLRTTTLYNPQARGSISDGAIVPIAGSVCGKAFRAGKNEHIDSFFEMRHDPESFASQEGQRFFEQVMAEGLKSGCELPLIGRSGVIGVLSALSRSEEAFF